MSTVDVPGACARFQWKAFGARNGWGFGSATAAWNGQAKKHPGEWPPTGVAVPIWLSWTKDPNGHAAISLADGRVLTSPVRGTTVGQEIYPSIQAMMNAFGGGMTYLGWGEQMDGTVVVEWVNTPVGPTQRQVGPHQVIRRAAPSTTAQIVEPSLEPGVVGNFNGWIRGESVAGNNVWFRGINGHYFWSGGFTSQSTAGLTDLNGAAPAPAPTPPTDVDTGAYTPNLVNPRAEDFPAWIRFETVLDKNESSLEQNRIMADYYGVKYDPVESHIHWWDAPEKKPSHDGTVNHLNTNDGLSVNFVVSENRVTMMVPLNVIAKTTGKRNPYAWKTENDPNLSEQGYKTLGFVHYLVERLNPKLAGEPIRRHKDFMVTDCSDLDPVKVRAYAEKFRTGELDPATGEPARTPTPTPEPTPTTDDGELKQSITGLTALIQKLIDLLKSIFKVGA